MSIQTKTISTKAYPDQKLGTSGLRKSVSVFQQPNYIENVIQSYFNTLVNSESLQNLRDSVFFVGGDGRYLMSSCIQKIIQVAAANKVKKLVIAQNGICSTPAASYCIRSLNLAGGIILTASHNPGGKNGDFGIKFNQANGGPALESFTDKFYINACNIISYNICDDLDIDISKVGSTLIYVCNGDQCDMFSIEVIDVIKPYAEFMKQLFDFDAIRNMISSGLKISVNCLHGVMGPFVKEILVNQLGMDEVDAKRCNILEDFGGLHPDPNLTYAAELVNTMKQGRHDIGVAFDGDGDRNMVIGKNGFFVTPCDSLAVLAGNLQCIPYFQRITIKGFARSMPTSAAVDRVAYKNGLKCFETPTGWKYFGNLLDAGEICLCGEESFGIGSSHIREKDGMWACLAWLSILANRNQPIEDIIIAHWKAYGRNFFTRFDYEKCDSDSSKAMMEHLETLCQLGSLIGKSFNKNNQSYTVEIMDNFSYIDPIDNSKTDKQGIRIIFTDGSRIIFRLSGTGSSGATIRMYIECYEPNPDKILENTAIKLKPLIDIALEISQLVCFTNRSEPDVVT